jgi:hypothetical protein
MCDWEDLRELQRQGVSVQSRRLASRIFRLGPAERRRNSCAPRRRSSHVWRRRRVFAFP